MLIATSGPIKGQVFSLPEADIELELGRHTDPIRILDRKASRRHAILSRRDGAWAIEDLGSTNGTLVNGRRIDDLRDLSPGDRITIGHSVLVFAEVPATAAAASTGDAPTLAAAAPAATPAVEGQAEPSPPSDVSPPTIDDQAEVEASSPAASGVTSEPAVDDVVSLDDEDELALDSAPAPEPEASASFSDLDLGGDSEADVHPHASDDEIDGVHDTGLGGSEDSARINAFEGSFIDPDSRGGVPDEIPQNAPEPAPEPDPEPEHADGGQPAAERPSDDAAAITPALEESEASEPEVEPGDAGVPTVADAGDLPVEADDDALDPVEADDDALEGPSDAGDALVDSEPDTEPLAEDSLADAIAEPSPVDFDEPAGDALDSPPVDGADKGRPEQPSVDGAEPLAVDEPGERADGDDDGVEPIPAALDGASIALPEVDDQADTPDASDIPSGASVDAFQPGAALDESDTLEESGDSAEPADALTDEFVGDPEAEDAEQGDPEAAVASDPDVEVAVDDEDDAVDFDELALEVLSANDDDLDEIEADESPEAPGSPESQEPPGALEAAPAHESLEITPTEDADADAEGPGLVSRTPADTAEPDPGESTASPSPAGEGMAKTASPEATERPSDVAVAGSEQRPDDEPEDDAGSAAGDHQGHAAWLRETDDAGETFEISSAEFGEDAIAELMSFSEQGPTESAPDRPVSEASAESDDGLDDAGDDEEDTGPPARLPDEDDDDPSGAAPPPADAPRHDPGVGGEGLALDGEDHVRLRARGEADAVEPPRVQPVATDPAADIEAAESPQPSAASPESDEDGPWSPPGDEGTGDDSEPAWRRSADVAPTERGSPLPRHALDGFLLNQEHLDADGSEPSRLIDRYCGRTESIEANASLPVDEDAIGDDDDLSSLLHDLTQPSGIEPATDGSPPTPPVDATRSTEPEAIVEAEPPEPALPPDHAAPLAVDEQPETAPSSAKPGLALPAAASPGDDSESDPAPPRVEAEDSEPSESLVEADAANAVAGGEERSRAQPVDQGFDPTHEQQDHREPAATDAISEVPLSLVEVEVDPAESDDELPREDPPAHAANGSPDPSLAVEAAVAGLIEGPEADEIEDAEDAAASSPQSSGAGGREPIQLEAMSADELAEFASGATGAELAVEAAEPDSSVDQDAPEGEASESAEGPRRVRRASRWFSMLLIAMLTLGSIGATGIGIDRWLRHGSLPSASGGEHDEPGKASTPATAGVTATHSDAGVDRPMAERGVTVHETSSRRRVDASAPASPRRLPARASADERSAPAPAVDVGDTPASNAGPDDASMRMVLTAVDATLKHGGEASTDDAAAESSPTPPAMRGLTDVLSAVRVTMSGASEGDGGQAPIVDR